MEVNVSLNVDAIVIILGFMNHDKVKYFEDFG